jgi:hypothetical protein
MTTLIDEQVNAWMKEMFLASGQYVPDLHGTPDQIRVIAADAGWECGCYSSWTRDDGFELEAKMEGAHGYFLYRYGRWADFPDFIHDLDEYINGNGCYYESDEYNDGLL